MAIADGNEEVVTTPWWFSKYFLHLTGPGKGCEIKFLKQGYTGKRTPIKCRDKVYLLFPTTRFPLCESGWKRVCGSHRSTGLAMRIVMMTATSKSSNLGWKRLMSVERGNDFEDEMNMSELDSGFLGNGEA